MPSLKDSGKPRRRIPTPKKKSTETTKTLVVGSEATIHIEKKATINLGDYSSASTTVGITVPVDASDELLARVDLTITKALELVDERLEEEINALDV